MVLETFVEKEDLSLESMVTVGLKDSLKKGLIDYPIIQLDEDTWVEFGELAIRHVFDCIIL